MTGFMLSDLLALTRGQVAPGTLLADEQQRTRWMCVHTILLCSFVLLFFCSYKELV